MSGIFSFDMPFGFITPLALEYLETIPGGQGWIDMVKAYLQLESLPKPKTVCTLPFFFGLVLITPSSAPSALRLTRDRLKSSRG